MDRYLGMYVHMHWAYNHPYAARTWTMDDWRSYASAMSKLGYNLLMIWPMTETVPDPPTPSDVAQFEFFGQVAEMLQEEFDFTVIFTLGPNTIGNDKAANYDWCKRPFFETDTRLNPADSDQMGRLMRMRRELLKPLARADGFAIIDSDPGGYIGSTNNEFADILEDHLEMLRNMNPKTMLYYWMWVGWESYNRFWKEAEETGQLRIESDDRDWEVVVRRMMAWPQDSWRVFSCNDRHQAVLEKLGVADKAVFFPYGLIEGEPSFPHTNCFPDEIERRLDKYVATSSYLGCIGNSQTHAVQQPNAYLFSHFAQGKSAAEADMESFAENLIPGMGKIIAKSWTYLSANDLSGARPLAAELNAAAARDPRPGAYSGLLLRPPRQFLEDLALQLTLAADLADLTKAVSSSDWKPAVKATADSLGAWSQRTGFVDASWGPFEAALHQALPQLHIPGIDAVLADYNNWRDPSVRHRIIPRLIRAMNAAAG